MIDRLETTPLKTADNLPLTGIKKSVNGGLIVDDSVAFNKYKREKQLLQRITALERQVKELSQSMLQIKRNTNG